MKTNIEIDQYKAALSYDPETGVFRWKSKVCKRIPLGAEAGFKKWHGYIYIQMNGCAVAAPRIAFALMKGHWPEAEIDHINGCKHDNRWINLRPATASQNRANMGLGSRNKSGFKGVHWNQKNQKWRASIRVDGRHLSLGLHQDVERAAKAYRDAAEIHHGEFANF